MSLNAETLARTLADLDRRLRGVERASQSGRTSVETPSGETLVLADAAARGVAASGIAEEALASANGKNTVHHSTLTPYDAGVDGSADGDIWFQHDGADVVIGQWRWDGGAWVAQTLAGEVLAYLDAGKITTGVLSAIDIEGVNVTGSTFTGSEYVTATDPDTGAYWSLQNGRIEAYSGDVNDAPGGLTINSGSLNFTIPSPWDFGVIAPPGFLMTRGDASASPNGYPTYMDLSAGIIRLMPSESSGPYNPYLEVGGSAGTKNAQRIIRNYTPTDFYPDGYNGTGVPTLSVTTSGLDVGATGETAQKWVRLKRLRGTTQYEARAYLTAGTSNTADYAFQLVKAGAEVNRLNITETGLVTTKALTVGGDLVVGGLSAGRGLVGIGTQTVDSAGATSTTQIDSGLSVSFTAVAGRRYKVSVLGAIKSSASGDRGSVIVRDATAEAANGGTNVYLMISQTVPMPAANSSIGVNNAVVVAPTAGSKTYKVWLQRVSGSGTVVLAGAATDSQIVVEDIGAA